jgi:hypothetical protein
VLVLVLVVVLVVLVVLVLTVEKAIEHETSELVRQLFFRFYLHVYSQFRGVLGGSLGVV